MFNSLFSISFDSIFILHFPSPLNYIFIVFISQRKLSNLKISIFLELCRFAQALDKSINRLFLSVTLIFHG